MIYDCKVNFANLKDLISAAELLQQAGKEQESKELLHKIANSVIEEVKF